MSHSIIKCNSVILGLCVMALAFALPASAQEAAKPQSATMLTAAGSGVNLGITRLLAAAFSERHPTIISIPGSIGTKGAITAIKDNAITFGLISRPLKDKEMSPDYVAVPYAKTALVLAANSNVKDIGVSSPEVVSIYKGDKAKWSDGSGIVVLIREAFDSGFMTLEEKISGLKEACEESRKANRWTVHFTDQDANKALSETKNAIGVTDLGMIATEKLDVKPLALDGVMPSVEALSSGQYALTRTLFLLYRPKDMTAEAKAFVDFLRSPEAAAIMKANGYIPLAADAAQ